MFLSLSIFASSSLLLLSRTYSGVPMSTLLDHPGLGWYKVSGHSSADVVECGSKNIHQKDVF